MYKYILYTKVTYYINVQRYLYGRNAHSKHEYMYVLPTLSNIPNFGLKNVDIICKISFFPSFHQYFEILKRFKCIGFLKLDGFILAFTVVLCNLPRNNKSVDFINYIKFYHKIIVKLLK